MVLEIIRQTAISLCGELSTSGHASQYHADAEVKAKLNGMMKKLLDIGISTNGSINLDDYTGVLLKHPLISDDCKRIIEHP
jgi:hypothetical protein